MYRLSALEKKQRFPGLEINFGKAFMFQNDQQSYSTAFHMNVVTLDHHVYNMIKFLGNVHLFITHVTLVDTDRDAIYVGNITAWVGRYPAFKPRTPTIKVTFKY